MSINADVMAFEDRLLGIQSPRWFHCGLVGRHEASVERAWAPNFTAAGLGAMRPRNAFWHQLKVQRAKARLVVADFGEV